MIMIFLTSSTHKAQAARHWIEAHLGSARGARSPVDLQTPRETSQDYPGGLDAVARAHADFDFELRLASTHRPRALRLVWVLRGPDASSSQGIRT